MDGWGMGRGAVNWKMIEIRVLQIDEQESLIKENKKERSRQNSWPQLWKSVELKKFFLGPDHVQVNYS